MKKMNIPFSPPDITEEEISAVADALRSGWITTGPKTKEFEKRIAEFCGTNTAVALNSATASMELTLRLLGVGPGDEVITSAYTYTASASVIEHVGAKIVLVDIQENSFEMDYDQLSNAITDKTKVIIPVDIAGIMCDYEKIFDIVDNKRDLFQPNNEIQNKIGRVIIMADAAHSFGATLNGKKSGQVADFSCFSFHAVKNLTTAEGGAVTWRNDLGLVDERIYQEYMLLSLHGQSKDALSKTKLGSWEYDIVYPAYKCNMTDIMASIGLVQLERYPQILERRREIIRRYNEKFISSELSFLKHLDENSLSSGHLYMVRIRGINEKSRNQIIEKMAVRGIATNVHYKPLPMMTAYKNMGFNQKNYPNSYSFYKNEITIPLHTLLKDEEIDYIIDSFLEILKEYIHV